MSVILRAVILISIVIVPGCSDDETPTSLTPPPSGMSLSVSVSPNRIVAGDKTTVTLVVEYYGPDFTLDYDCMDHFGFSVAATDGSLSMDFPFCVEDPHKFVIRNGFKRTVKFAIPYLRYIHPPLHPARYTISAGFMEHEDKYPWVSTELIVLMP